MNKNFIFGILVFFWGFFFLGRSYDFFPYELEHHIFSFPMLIINLGLISVLFSKKNAFGIVVLIIGVMMMMIRVFDIDFNFRKLFIPITLILLGIVLSLKALKKTKGKNKTNLMNKSSKANELIVLGSSEIKVDETYFSDKKEYELYVDVILGSIKIYIPVGVKVENKVSVMLSDVGFKDTLLEVESDKILIINGNLVMASMKIRRY